MQNFLSISEILYTEYLWSSSHVFIQLSFMWSTTTGLRPTFFHLYLLYSVPAFQLCDFYNSSYFCTKSFKVISQFWGYFFFLNLHWKIKGKFCELLLWILFLSIKMVNRQTGLHCSHICYWSATEISSHFKTWFCFSFLRTVTTDASLNAEHWGCYLVELRTCCFSCRTSSSQIILTYNDCPM